MIIIDVPDSSYSSQSVTLGGNQYEMTYRYNSREDTWRMDIRFSGRDVILGVKIMPNQNLLEDYILDDFDHGSIACIRVRGDLENVGRNNLGIDKEFFLVYATNEEIASF